VAEEDHGRLSFVETISVLDRWPEHIDPRLDPAVVFFNTAESFSYRRPDELVDLRSGVISMPTNFPGTPPEREGLFRVTVLADYDRWTALPEERYREQKQRASDAALAATAAFLPDVRTHEVYRDVFTPRTIHKYTAKHAGAIYGSPHKRRDGLTPVEGLLLCGTDQGFLGVIGAAVSGIAMATRLQTTPAAPLDAQPHPL
jgi:phytoene dehydrogenase-like protein